MSFNQSRVPPPPPSSTITSTLGQVPRRLDQDYLPSVYQSTSPVSANGSYPYNNANSAPRTPVDMPDTAAASPTNSKRQRLDPIDPAAPAGDDAFIQDHDAAESGGDDDDGDGDKPESGKKAGRRKIKIEFIQDKSRRHITFSKRKAGIMKKVRGRTLLIGVWSLSSHPAL